MQKLIVHIGCAKGGSSAIQKALRLNHRELAARGIVVPSCDLQPDSEVTGSHAGLFESCVRNRRAHPIPQFVELLDAAGARQDASTVLLSAENLSNPLGFEKLFEALTDRFAIEIVFYVRRQDELLEATWQQWNIKLGGSLLEWMIRSIGNRGNWYATLEPWASAFGDKRIVVRVYDRSRLVGGDVFLDFCDVLGLDAGGLERPGETNAGLNPMLSRMIEGNAGLFDGPHDQAFYESVRQLAPELAAKPGDAPGLFSPGEARAIMQVYARSNERFRRRYLRHMKPPLFPIAESSGKLHLTQGEFERHLVQQQIFSLHQQVEALRQHPARKRWKRLRDAVHAQRNARRLRSRDGS